MFTTNNEIVDKVGEIHIEGNVIPSSWFRFFTFENGKPDLVAIYILSEIVYWYRPTIMRDEHTGMVVEVRKKFKADLLQRSYNSFSDLLGVTKRQAKEALDRLEKTGVIYRDFRTINNLHNVLFIGLNVDILVKSLGYTPLHSNVTPPTLERNTPYVETEDPLHSNVTPPTLERKTYTEITTENTTNNITPTPTPKTKQGGEYSDEFEQFWSMYPDKTNQSKKQTHSKFKLALKKVSFEKIMAGLKNYITFLNTTGNQFVKHATTWLNNECWESEYTIANQQNNLAPEQPQNTQVVQPIANPNRKPKGFL